MCKNIKTDAQRSTIEKNKQIMQPDFPKLTSAFKFALILALGGLIGGAIFALDSNANVYDNTWTGLAWKWFPGLIYGFVYGFLVKKNFNYCLSVGTISALVHFFIMEAFFNGLGSFSVIICGLFGALMLSIFIPLLLQQRITLKSVFLTSLFGAIGGFLFALIFDFDVVLNSAIAYAVWQGLVGFIMIYSIDEKEEKKKQTLNGWRWVLDAIGLVGTILGIVSFFY